jgi:general transcription factor 3C polypeptide 5 (transcription factor C subunit 1)
MLAQILDSDDPEECLPLYLRPKDPLCVPTLSVIAPTTNVVLQITVPKRTGRKRKRGSQDPYLADNGQSSFDARVNGSETNFDIPISVRNDNPVTLRRMLQDNVDKYTWKAVGTIKHTHRFRGDCVFLLLDSSQADNLPGMSDFQQSTGHERFIPHVKETFLRASSKKRKLYKYQSY